LRENLDVRDEDAKQNDTRLYGNGPIEVVTKQ
jgi:hypothetical protein